ncbi:MAG: GNAT family N-acetyltransferase [Defluviitaleaceae bacterium]|nr:GNAT family N-acetyltransferase [Defluviitaleaceae bacterium]
MITVGQYIDDPCKTCATAFWKEAYFPKPDNIEILHEQSVDKNRAAKYTQYFRLIHHLSENQHSYPSVGFAVKNVNLLQEANFVSDFINRCYVGYSQSKETVLRWAQYPVYDEDLWIWIWDETTNAPVALGIADFDVSIGEGSLEWIQVLPEYRGRGFGQLVVNELLARLKTKAKFVTVSGEVNSDAKPEELYRKCGFVGNDIWYVKS